MIQRFLCSPCQFFRGWLATALLTLSAGASAQNLIVNGGFESGFSGWSTWDTHEVGFSPWLRDGTCVLWGIPPAACISEGSAIYAQRNATYGRARGGIYQIIPVLPGRQYRISGVWSGNFRPNAISNMSWWTLVAMEGEAQPAMIDPPWGYESGQIVAEEWVGALQPAFGEYQFGPMPFSRDVQVGPHATSITLLLRHYAVGMGSGRAHLDAMRMELLGPYQQPIPAHDRWALMTLAFGLLAIAVTWQRTRATQSVA